ARLPPHRGGVACQGAQGANSGQGSARSAGSSVYLPPRGRDHVLEIKQVRPERGQVCFYLAWFLFYECEYVGVTERRKRLPEFFPNAARGPQTEAVVGRDEWARGYFGHPAFLDAQEGETRCRLRS